MSVVGALVYENVTGNSVKDIFSSKTEEEAKGDVVKTYVDDKSEQGTVKFSIKEINETM